MVPPLRFFTSRGLGCGPPQALADDERDDGRGIGSQRATDAELARPLRGAES
jgi:hypothetical protein